MEEDMSSMISNGGENVSAEGSNSNSAIYPIPPSKHVCEGYKFFTESKGVVPLQNGNWGAQIYANDQLIWLGTFKSKKEAVMAYDSAAMRVLSGYSHRNFPWTSITVEEPKFQSQYSSEVVLNMIKDGSYQRKFAEFSRTCYQVSETSHDLNLSMLEKRGGGLSCKQLFQKELTPSDVGNLNRLVVPKKHAMKHFPVISRYVEENAEAGKVDDTELVLFDRMMRCWKFRYCYWKSSQSFVFTRGWSQFVREKQLKANDVIAFCLCEAKDGDKVVEKFCMIEVIKSKDSGSSTAAANQHTGFQLGLLEPDLEHELIATGSASENERKGFKLFGVRII